MHWVCTAAQLVARLAWTRQVHQQGVKLHETLAQIQQRSEDACRHDNVGSKLTFLSLHKVLSVSSGAVRKQHHELGSREYTSQHACVMLGRAQ